MTYCIQLWWENLQKTNKVYSQLEFGNITEADFRARSNGGSLAAVAARMVLFGA